MQMESEEILCRLQLIRSENIGPHSFAALLARFGSARAALEALRSGAALLPGKAARRPVHLARREAVERELAYAEKTGTRFIALGEADYPLYLKESDNPPPLIAAKGNIKLLQRRSLAIVGSRSASAIGQRLSSLFAHALGEAGFAICSGFARGIDSCAHKAALKSGTIAIVAGGVDYVYPAENGKLYQEILAQGGVFLSEMPLGFQPRAADFPRRNRLIAALSLGLLVVEASERSGSLITARYAAEAGRIVFATPGSPLDPRAKGTNSLIKNGACLVDRPEDIIEILTPLTGRHGGSAAADDVTLFARPDKAQQHFAAGAAIMADEEEPAISAAPPEREPQYNIIAPEGGSGAAKTASAMDRGSPELPIRPPAATAAPITAAADARHESAEDLTEAERQCLQQSLSLTPIAIDSLARATQIPLSRLYLGLMELELAGRLVRHNGGMVSTLPD
ncbi:DNA-processing protein DprA [Candidatus Tokpelaia sp.]|uniref:DNA-processing protein DprA n=1 Tax=Candidatus Tokpelaia sp. TaxID=2233777 RepID=UPI001FEDE12F|nr:DNA-processing protein DprA [Candidatus Tokpelaia sp.]